MPASRTGNAASTSRDYLWLGRAEAGLEDGDGALASAEAARQRWRDAEVGTAEQLALEALLSRLENN